jgi:hypothetical protein
MARNEILSAFPIRIIENSTILKNVKTVSPWQERRFPNE